MICIIDHEIKNGIVKWAYKDDQDNRVIIETRLDCIEDFGEQRCFATGETLYTKGSYTQEQRFRHVIVLKVNTVNDSC